MKPPPFAYHAPAHLEDIFDLLERYGDDAKVLAGGQSLMPLLNFRLSYPSALIDINHVADLSYLQQEDGQIRIGALTRQRTIEFSELVRRRLPLLHEATTLVGHLRCLYDSHQWRSCPLVSDAGGAGRWSGVDDR